MDATPRNFSIISAERLEELARRVAELEGQTQTFPSSGQVLFAFQRELSTTHQRAFAELDEAFPEDQRDAARRLLREVFVGTLRDAKALERPALLAALQPRTGGPLPAPNRRARQAFARAAVASALCEPLEPEIAAALTRIGSLPWMADYAKPLSWRCAVACPACKANAAFAIEIHEITVRDGELAVHARGKCAACGHYGVDNTSPRRFLDAPRMRDAVCACQHCADATARFTLEIRRIARTEGDELPQRYAVWREAVLADARVAPTLEQMERDFRAKRALLTADGERMLRALLQPGPSSTHEFDVRLAALAGEHDDHHGATIVDMLREYGVLYRVDVVRQQAPAIIRGVQQELEERHDTFFYSVDGRSQGALSRDCEASPRLTRSIRDACALAFGDDASVSNRMQLTVQNESLWAVDDAYALLVWSRFLHGLAQASVEREELLEERLLVNPHWIEHLNSDPLARPGDVVARAGAIATSRPLFRTPERAAAYARLCAEFPNAIIVPDRPIRSLLDLEQLPAEIPGADRERLHRTCVAFAIYDVRGRAILVEDVDGDVEHEAPASLRRLALGSAGIPLRLAGE